MKTIWVTFQKEGIHMYPGADTDSKLATGGWDDVSFLGVPHRHIFHFKIWIQVVVHALDFHVGRRHLQMFLNLIFETNSS